MLNLIDEVSRQKKLTKLPGEAFTLVSTPGNPFVPSNRLSSKSTHGGEDWAEVIEKESEHNFVLEVINEQVRLTEKALSKVPDSPFLLNDLGALYLNAGKVQESTQFFERALSIKDDLVSARMNLAKAQLLSGNLNAALAIYTELLTHYPNRSVIHENLGGIYLRLAIAQKSQAYLGKAEHHLKQSGEANPSALNNLGIVFTLHGNLRLALNYFKKALSVEPRSAKTNLNIGICYLRAKNIEKATRYISASLSLDRKNIEAAKSLARIYLTLKEYRKVSDLLSEFEKYGKADPVLLELLAEAQYYTKNYTSCLKLLMSVRQRFETSQSESTGLERVYNNVGSVYLASGDNEKAEEFYRKSVSQSPDKATDAYYNLIDLYHGQNRYEEAAPLIRVLQKEVPESFRLPAFRTRFNLLMGRHQFYMKDYAGALSSLSEAQKLEPANPLSYIGIGFILAEAKQDYDAAIEMLKQGLAYESTNYMLLNNLAYYFLMKGNAENAKEILERINEQDALNSVHVNATRGLLLLKENALEKGSYYYNRAIDLAKDEETKNQARQKKQLEWGRYFLSQGKTARARKYLQDAIVIKTQFDLYRLQAENLLKNC